MAARYARFGTCGRSFTLHVRARISSVFGHCSFVCSILRCVHLYGSSFGCAGCIPRIVCQFVYTWRPVSISTFTPGALPNSFASSGSSNVNVTPHAFYGSL